MTLNAEQLSAQGNIDIRQIDTKGGAAVTGDVNAEVFIGRDKVIQIFVHLGFSRETFQKLEHVLKQHYQVLAWVILLEASLGLLFFQNKDRYLIPWWTYITTALLSALTIWIWWKLLSTKSLQPVSRKFQLFTGILTISGFCLVGQQIKTIVDPQQITPEKFGIAIAMFGDGPDFRVSRRSREISSLLLTDLNRVIARHSTLSNTIELRQLGVIQNFEQGDKAAKRIGAKLVLWGYILENDEGYVIHYQISEVPGFTDDSAFPRVLPVVQPYAQTSIEISNPGILRVKDAASKQNLGLAAFCLGLYYYLAESSPVQASEQFKTALDFLKIQTSSDNKTNLGLVYYYLGKSYQLLGKYEDSQEIFEQAEELNPDEPAILIGQIYNYYVLGDEANKRITIEKVIQLTKRRPKDELAAIYDRALTYEAAEDYDKALYEYSTILKCQQNFSECLSDFFIAYLSAARVLIRFNRFDDAQNLYKQAEVLTEGDQGKRFWLLVDLGKFYEEKQEFESAIDLYSEAIQLRSSLITPYLFRSKLYEEMGLLDAALLDYKKIIVLSENPSSAYSNLAAFYYRIHNFSEAIVQYQEVLHSEPPNESLIHAYIGQACAEMRDEKCTFYEFNLALTSSSPTESYIRSIYGISLTKLGYTDEAIVQMEMALKLSVAVDIETSLNLGQLYESTGKNQKAKALYKSLMAFGDLIADDRLQIVNERLKSLEGTGNPTPGIPTLLPPAATPRAKG